MVGLQEALQLSRRWGDRTA